MKSNRVKINPNILKWALDNINYSIPSFAKKIGQKELTIKKWLDGESFPTYKQLEKISYDILKIPSIFFFSDYPPEDNLKADFRTTSPNTLKNLSPNIMITIKKIKALQYNLSKLFNNKNPIGYTFINNLKEIDNNNMEFIAEKLRNILNITIDKQKEFKTSEIALKEWRNSVEKNGIFIRKTALKNYDISGFCLYDKAFPIIVINNSQPFNRQIFTIFHEMAHLIFKISGLDELEENFSEISKNNRNIEILCNSFASTFLLPKNDILKYSGYNINDKNISNIANEFSVSREVVIKRCLDFNLIDKNTYKEYLEKYTKEYHRNIKRKKGGNYLNTKFSYLGENYIKLIFEEYYENKINKYELFDFLDEKKENNINKIEEMLYRKQKL